jgi:multicomponent Na+:H+ antiporter subunit E
MKILTLFVFAFLFWLALTWSFDTASIVTGGVVSAALAFLLVGVGLDEAPLLLWPQRLLWAFAYVPVLLLYVVRANLDVAYRVLHPALPIRPGIVRARTSLKTPAGRVLLANSITLTPGTLSVDMQGDVLYIHRIHVPEEDADGDTQRSLARFETFIRRIFE